MGWVGQTVGAQEVSLAALAFLRKHTLTYFVSLLLRHLIRHYRVKLPGGAVHGSPRIDDRLAIALRDHFGATFKENTPVGKATPSALVTKL